MEYRPSPPPSSRPYYKAPCMHRYRHLDTSKFKVSGENMRLKWKVVDRYYCEKCLTSKVKESHFEIGEYR